MLTLIRFTTTALPSVHQEKCAEMQVTACHLRMAAAKIAGLTGNLKKAAEINGLPLHPEGRMTKNPTFKQLSRLFENVVRYIIKSDNKDKEIIYKRGELSSDLKMVLTALSISGEEF